jgi:hypothetical protein
MVEAIEFEEWVDVLRRRIGAADALDHSGACCTTSAS